MRILVTGGAGFQGSHLTERWVSSGHSVTILNTFSEQALLNLDGFKDTVQVIWGSITDPEIVEKTVRGHDIVVHLAARINVDESIREPKSYLTVNVMGTYNVLEAVRTWGCRLIYASSCEVYGSFVSAPISETAELKPHSPYAASKAGADRLCMAYHRTYGLNVSIIRPCNVFGERQKGGKGGAVIPRFVENALAGQPLAIYGDGSQRREYMYVEDLVAAYELVLLRPDLSGETINFGTGDIVSIKEIGEFITSRVGGSMKSTEIRPGEVSGFQLDSTKARLLGYKPKVGFWDGLSRYISWRQRVGSS